MMFEYFPDNYPWSMAVQMALNAGGNLSEADEVLRPLKLLASDNDEAANRAWHDAWASLGVRNQKLAKEDADHGREQSAGSKFLRAATYFMTGERMCKSGSAERLETYKSMLGCFNTGLNYLRSPAIRVEVPFRDTSLPAIFYPAQNKSGLIPPCLIHLDGLDVMKEYLYLAGVPQAYAQRGISTLLLDHPGMERRCA